MFSKKDDRAKTTRMLDYDDLAYVIPELAMEPALPDLSEPSDELMKIVQTLAEKVDRDELDADNASLFGECFEPCYELHAARYADQCAAAGRWLTNVELSAITQLTALDEHGETLRVAEEEQPTEASAVRSRKRPRPLVNPLRTPQPVPAS